MRQIEVDERDSSWEIDEARFRVYVFSGAGNAVTTFDFVHATIEQALDEASYLAGRDKHLWSLALVHDDPESGRGLVWLSGNDYNDYPRADLGTAAYWRHRGKMQSRYLNARVQAGEPAVLPTGERSIRMFPEWSVDLPLWEDHTEHYPVEPGVLPLSTALEQSLMAWNRRWEELANPDLASTTSTDSPEWSAWFAEGVAHLAALRAELRGVAEIRPDFFIDD